MENYISRGLKTVLEGKCDVSEHTVGRYHVWMKWDGYSAMVDVHYLRANGQHAFTICHWDSLDKRIEVQDSQMLHGANRRKLVMAIRAIRQLGYEINEINWRGENLVPTFLKHIAS